MNESMMLSTVSVTRDSGRRVVRPAIRWNFELDVQVFAKLSEIERSPDHPQGLPTDVSGKSLSSPPSFEMIEGAN